MAILFWAMVDYMHVSSASKLWKNRRTAHLNEILGGHDLTLVGRRVGGGWGSRDEECLQDRMGEDRRAMRNLYIVGAAWLCQPELRPCISSVRHSQSCPTADKA